jgi:sulfatase modifying factor 1
MKTKNIFLLGAIALLFLSARREKITVYDLRYVENNLMYIPTTSFHLGLTDEEGDIAYTAINRPRMVCVDSFYMSRYEMTNGMYCYYLHELQKAKVDTAIYNKALPDTLVWREKMAYNEPYVEYYLRHPAYADYPLVGVSYDQAVEFCKWLTTTYNAWPERKYSKVKFDLPSRDQWLCAAHGGMDLAFLPWEGPYMMDKEGKAMANFMAIDLSSVYRKVVPEINVYGDTVNNTYLVAGNGAGRYHLPRKYSGWDLDYYSDVTAPVKSYYPNVYGLYNLAGNVEEMIREKGITKGGSWKDPGYYLQNETDENYTDSTATSAERGFRMMMQVVR